MPGEKGSMEPMPPSLGLLPPAMSSSQGRLLLPDRLRLLDRLTDARGELKFEFTLASR